jgi:hypothetical protein
MRSDVFTSSFAQRPVEANTYYFIKILRKINFYYFSEATQIELHKESRWYSGWKAFSESNPYYNSLFFNWFFN